MLSLRVVQPRAGSPRGRQDAKVSLVLKLNSGVDKLGFE